MECYQWNTYGSLMVWTVFIARSRTFTPICLMYICIYPRCISGFDTKKKYLDNISHRWRVHSLNRDSLHI